MLWALKKTGLVDQRKLKKYSWPGWLLDATKELKGHPLFVAAKNGSYH